MQISSVFQEYYLNMVALLCLDFHIFKTISTQPNDCLGNDDGE